VYLPEVLAGQLIYALCTGSFGVLAFFSQLLVLRRYSALRVRGVRWNVAYLIIGIPVGHLLLAVGLLELCIAFFCLFTDKHQLSLPTVAWPRTSLVGYSFRVRFTWLGCP